MDVRIGAVAAVAQVTANEVQTVVEIITVAALDTPTVSRPYSCPVISIGGTSISSINPEFVVGVIKAVA